MLPQDPDPRGGRTHPVRRAHPHPEGEEEEPLHILPPERIHLLRERQAPRPVPARHGPGQGLRRRLEWPRSDEAVRPPFRSFPSHLFLSLASGRMPDLGACNRYTRSHRRITPSRFIISGRPPSSCGTVKIQFHKILSEGRSVRYDPDPDPDDGVLHLSVIVTEDEVRRNRAKRTS